MKSRLGTAATLVAGLALLVGVLYHRSLDVGFLSDDWYFLRIAMTGGPSFLPRIDPSDSQAHHFVPIGELWFYLLFEIFDLNSRAWHSAKLLLHALNAALVYVVARRVMHTSREGALLASIAFAACFLYYESVIWIAGLFYVGAAPFFLLSLLFYSSFLESGGALRYLAYVACFLMALLCIEGGVAVLGAAFLLDLLRPSPEVRAWVKLLGSCVRQTPALVAFLAYWLWRFIVLDAGRGASEAVPVVKMAGTTVYALFGFFSAGIPHVYLSFFEVKRLAAAVVLTLCFIVIARGNWRVRFCLLAFVAAYSPYIALSGLNARYFYLPGIFSALFLGVLLDRPIVSLGDARISPKALLIGCAATLIATSVSYRQERLEEWEMAASQTAVALTEIQRSLVADPDLFERGAAVVDVPDSVGSPWGTSFPAYIFRNGLAEAISIEIFRNPVALPELDFVRSTRQVDWIANGRGPLSEAQITDLSRNRAQIRFAASPPAAPIVVHGGGD